MFYDLAEQVFILNLTIWRPERENREKNKRVLIPITAFAYKFNEQPKKAGALFSKERARYWPVLAILSRIYALFGLNSVVMPQN